MYITNEEMFSQLKSSADNEPSSKTSSHLLCNKTACYSSVVCSVVCILHCHSNRHSNLLGLLLMNRRKLIKLRLTYFISLYEFSLQVVSPYVFSVLCFKYVSTPFNAYPRLQSITTIVHMTGTRLAVCVWSRYRIYNVLRGVSIIYLIIKLTATITV